MILIRKSSLVEIDSIFNSVFLPLGIVRGHFPKIIKFDYFR